MSFSVTRKEYFLRNILPGESNAVNAYFMFGKGGWASEIFIKLNHDALNGQRTMLTNTPAHLSQYIPIRGYTQVVTSEGCKMLTKYVIGSTWKNNYLHKKGVC